MTQEKSVPWFANPRAVIKENEKGEPRSIMEWHINNKPIVQIDFSTIAEKLLFGGKK